MCTTVTSTALLDELRLGKEDAWRRFCARYQPAVLAMARHSGLQEPDAQDVVQETLAAFVAAFRAGKYDRERGRLRAYLQGFAIRKIQEARRKPNRREVQMADRTGSTAPMDRIPDNDTLTDIFVKEEEHQLLAEWLEEIRQKVDATTFTAFDLQVRAGWPAERVAGHLGMTTGAVFQATFRVRSHLRKRKDQMGELWEDG